MAIDPSIITQLQPYQAPDIGASMQRGLTLRHLMQQEQMQRLQMAKLQEASQSEQAAQQAFRDAGGDQTQFLNNLQQRGLYKQYLTAQQEFAERAKQQAAIEAQNVETASKSQALRQSRIQSMAQSLLANPNPQFAAQMFDMAVKSKWLNPEETAMFTRMFDTDPNGVNRNLLALVAKPDEVAKMFSPDMKAQDLGGSVQMVDMNALTNPNQGPLTKTATPGEVMTDARGKEANQINWGQLSESRRHNKESEKTARMNADSARITADGEIGRAHV